MFEMVGPLQSPLRIINILVVHLLLADFCRGQVQLTGPSQPIVATLGDDIILPCHLAPGADVAGKTLEWTRSELDPRFVFVWRAGQDLMNLKNPSYKGRTSLFTDELKHGNISLKLSDVKPSDRGRYKCFIPDLNTESFVELVVASGAASSPSISLSGLDRNKGAVVLQCESAGWYPEPEVFWLDGEGNLLSAGPTETVRGPDDLYTVSSRVTVEKRHSNSFTCRVQQNSTNQIREAKIHVPDDFFEVQSSFSSTTVGLVVTLAVCILVFLILGFFLWRQKKKREEKKREHEEKEKENLLKSKLMEDQQKLEVEQQRREGAENRVKTLEEELQKLKEEQQRREEAENRVQILEEEQQKKIREWENKFKEEEKKREKEVEELNIKLQEEKKRREEEVQRKNQELQEKTDQMRSKDETIRKERRDKEEAQSEVMRLKDHLQSKNKEVDGLKAEVNKLTEEKKRSEEERQKLQTKITEKQNSSSLSQNSTRKPAVVFEVDPLGKYIQLRNTSTEVQQLRGWTLKIKVNDKEPVIYTFKDSFNLEAGKVFTVGYRYYSSYPRADLKLKDLEIWSFTDNLQVSLISNTGEIQYN